MCRFCTWLTAVLQMYTEHEKITAYRCVLGPLRWSCVSDVENSDTWCHLCEEWYGESARRRR